MIFFGSRRNIRLLLLCLLLTTVCSEGQELGDTVSQDGLFSYQAPKGWPMQQKTPWSKYDIPYDQERNLAGKYGANIIVTVGLYPNSLADAVAATKQAMSNDTKFTNLVFVDEQSFLTSAGIKGVRIVAKATEGTMNLEHIAYFFEGSSNNKIEVVCTCLADDIEHYTPIFDASMKTFSPK